MKKLLIALLLPAALFAQKQPRLIVGIVVDQMRFEMLQRYKSSFGPNGFNRLMAEGFSYDSCTYNYIPTYTAPGHATIFTGKNPDVHGILGNDMYLAAEMRTMNCVEDREVQPVGTFDKNAARSPKHLKAATLGDSLKTANPKSKVIAISGKDRGAILPGGKLADAAYWLDNNSFIATSSYYMKQLPLWVDSFFYSGFGITPSFVGWELLQDNSFYKASLPDNSPYESTEMGDPPTLPYVLRPLFEKNGLGTFRSTPYANNLLTEFAIWAMQEEGMGVDKHTDLLTISYSATDLIGHRFGPQSVEVHDTYLRLDEDFSRLIDSLDAHVGRKNYVLFLTSDHGVANTPADKKFHYVTNEVLKTAINQFTTQQFGKELVAHISNSQIWLQQQTMQLYKLKPQEVVSAIQQFLLSQKELQLKEIYTRTDVQLSTSGSALYFKNAFNAELSGDLFYTRPFGAIEQNAPTGTTHGTHYLYDTHVPLIFFGGNVSPGRNVQPIHVHQILNVLKTYIEVEEK